MLTDPTFPWLDAIADEDDRGEAGIPPVIKIVGFALLAVAIVTTATAIANGWLGIIPTAE